MDWRLEGEWQSALDKVCNSPTESQMGPIGSSSTLGIAHEVEAITYGDEVDESASNMQQLIRLEILREVGKSIRRLRRTHLSYPSVGPLSCLNVASLNPLSKTP